MIKKRAFIIIILGAIGVFAFQGALALEIDWPSIPGAKSPEETTNLLEIIKYFYTFAVAISGITALVIFIYAGVQWMASGASPGLKQDAKDRMTKAGIGILLLLGSYLILSVINPELVALKLPSLGTIKAPPSPVVPECELLEQYECLEPGPDCVCFTDTTPEEINEKDEYKWGDAFRSLYGEAEQGKEAAYIIVNDISAIIALSENAANLSEQCSIENNCSGPTCSRIREPGCVNDCGDKQQECEKPCLDNRNECLGGCEDLEGEEKWECQVSCSNDFWSCRFAADCSEKYESCINSCWVCSTPIPSCTGSACPPEIQSAAEDARAKYNEIQNQIGNLGGITQNIKNMEATILELKNNIRLCSIDSQKMLLTCDDAINFGFREEWPDICEPSKDENFVCAWE